MEKPALTDLAIANADLQGSSAAAATRTVQARFHACVTLMRPHQWTKNLVCFAGLFFAGKALVPSAVLQTSIAFVAFCLSASFVYALNDIFDKEKDLAHPTKRFRPLPSGRLTLIEAASAGLLSLASALLLSYSVKFSVLLCVVAYITINLAYTLSLKNRVLVDVMLISFGFILRILVGTEAAGVPPSAWIILCAFFLSLFLGFGKRRAELNHLSGRQNQSRVVLTQYSVAMLDRFCNIFATLSIASYALFTVTARMDHSLLVTCPAVVFGLLRYLFLIEARDGGESPDIVLLKDRPLQMAIFLWVILTSLVLYSQFRLNIL